MHYTKQIERKIIFRFYGTAFTLNGRHMQNIRKNENYIYISVGKWYTIYYIAIFVQTHVTNRSEGRFSCLQKSEVSGFSGLTPFP